MKEKNQLNFIKIKNKKGKLLLWKNSVKRMKKQATEWEKIITKHRSVKAMASKIYGLLKS